MQSDLCFVLFFPMPFRSMKYCTPPYPDELRLSRGWGTHHNGALGRPHARQITRAGTGKALAGRSRARAHKWPAPAQHTRASTGCLPRQAGKQDNKRANKDNVHAYRCKARARAHTHKRDMQCKYPGNGTRHVAVNVPCYDCCACAMILIMSGERGCGAWVPNEMTERRSFAQDTGQTGQSFADKSKTRTGKHDI